jgi:hypothetical protein
MKLDTRISFQRRLPFLILLAVMLFVAYSAATAIMTVDECGPDDAPKHWSFFPPEWVCEQTRF